MGVLLYWQYHYQVLLRYSLYSNIVVHGCYGSITGQCSWKHIGDDVMATSSSISVFGSVITSNVWNHVTVSTCKELQHIKNDVKSFKVSN